MDEWDDELSELPADRRRVVLRRGAYLATSAGLVVLIILTIAFVGNDTKSVATVGADAAATASGPNTTGFATSLPVGVTATSLSGGSTSTTSTASTNSTGATAGTTTPGQNPTTTAPAVNSPATTSPARTTSTSTTTTVPPFFFAQPHQAVGAYQAQTPTPGCPPAPAMPDQDFTFFTPQPGTLEVTDAFGTGSGPIDPSGNFNVFVVASKGTYAGQLPLSTTAGTVASGTFAQGAGCTNAYTVTWSFSN